MIELTSIVRTLIGDLGTTQSFSDERIEMALTVAGLMVDRDVQLSTKYTFDLISNIIEPNPVEVGDMNAIALFTLKAACILNQNQYMSAVGSGIRVRDGSSEVDTTGSFGGYRDILKNGPCAAYQALSKKLIMDSSALGGRAVASPYSLGESGRAYYTGGAWTAYRFFGTYLGAV